MNGHKVTYTGRVDRIVGPAPAPCYHQETVEIIHSVPGWAGAYHSLMDVRLGRFAVGDEVDVTVEALGFIVTLPPDPEQN